MSLWQCVILVWVFAQASVVMSTVCNGHKIIPPEVFDITGCYDEKFLETATKIHLSDRYDWDKLNETEEDKLITHNVHQVVAQFRNKYNKAVGRNSPDRFDTLSREQQTALIFAHLQFGKYWTGSEKVWFDAAVSQDWKTVVEELENVEKSEEEKELFITAINLLQSDDMTQCCPDGIMYEGHCFFLGNGAVSVESARQYCNEKAKNILDLHVQLHQKPMEDTDLYGDLAAIHGQKVLDAVDIITGNGKYMIGAFKCSERNVKDNYVWTDDISVTKSETRKLWDGTESEYYCAAYHRLQGKIQEHSCDDELPFVCELAIPLASKAGRDIKKHEIAKIRQKAKKSRKGATGPILENCNTDESFIGCDIRTPPDSPLRPLQVVGTGQNTRKKRNTVVEDYRFLLWEYGEVPIAIDTIFNDEEFNNITLAIDSFNEHTCLDLFPYTNQPQYLLITRGYEGTTGCWSYIGKADPFANGPSPLNLGYGCTAVGTVQHELMHALGFVHEHTRPDRDDYVQVHTENILPGYESNFEKYPETLIHMEHGYDYESIMQYSMYAKSSNDLPTIVPLRPRDVPIGQRDFMTANDVAEVNGLYNCGVPINGSWGYWSLWGECDQPCGGGVRIRTRECHLPYPKNGGANCSGSGVAFDECNVDDCDVEIHPAGCWKYQVPGDLYNLNGEGILEGVDPNATNFKTLCSQEAQRHNANYRYFALNDDTCYMFDGNENLAQQLLFLEPSDSCNGRGSDDSVNVYRIGNGSMQAHYGPWQEPTLCSVTCGGGTKTRNRTCNNPPVREGYDDLPCEGDDSEILTCNDVYCPVHGQWGEWSEWGDCSRTCALGTKVRTRRCDNPPPEHGGSSCEDEFGSSEQTTLCNAGNCPAVEGCPVTLNTEATLFEPFEQYSFMDKCDDGGIAGIISKLKLKNPDAKLETVDGCVTFSPSQMLIGEFTGVKPCLFEPDLCKPGFGLEMKVELDGSLPGLTRRKRSTVEEGRSMVIFTTGVNTDTDALAGESQGIAVYVTHTGDLRATVVTTYKTYTAEIPGDLFDQDRYYNVFIDWSRLYGLWIAFKGIWIDSDLTGTLHSKFVTNVATEFCVGGPCSCQTEQYFSGYIKSLTIYDNLLVETVDPLPYTDLNTGCDICNVNADCDTSANTCTCKPGFEGDGILYCSPIPDETVPLLPDVDPVYTWPKTFSIVYSDNQFPGFYDGSNGLELVATNLVRPPHVSDGSDNVLVFNGVRDYISGGDDSPCYQDPSLCSEGLTVAFTMAYFGRGDHYNFIFSTGSMPWYPTTGMSMYVRNDMATVQLQTEHKLYKVEFAISTGERHRYIITWKETHGLTVYEGSNVHYSWHSYSPSSPNFYGYLIIGKPSIEHVVYNGWFEMEAFSFWHEYVKGINLK